ncbi:5'-deoxynucleotidase [Caproiciproducens sp. NJN-50]|uniref:5'-deoxynucleotidase n=1 Tax=Acutalibacteraceae TaxID=3082771 RepID=UPI000FFE1BEF|nr:MULTISPECIES: 5'-deoxynucleotidase [Acutalibacteraceae]QAT51008.1 5'-deoxynucleotidase [Caproiciproducens sp. NJN-50]
MFHFFAVLSRMKNINRWGLMRNTRQENLCEHSFETAVIAHALAVLRNTRFDGNADPGRAAALALFHDAPEIITGDMPTPVKYFSPKIRSAYREVESVARERLLGFLPEDLQGVYRPLLGETAEPGDAELLKLVRAADKISAVIKCVEEKRMGNTEFCQAETALRNSVRELRLPEADCFMEEFLPSFSLTLDEQE